MAPRAGANKQRRIRPAHHPGLALRRWQARGAQAGGQAQRGGAAACCRTHCRLPGGCVPAA